jgi:hypothetical protein
LSPSVALRTGALLLLVLGLARAAGGVVLVVSGGSAVESQRVGLETARALGAGLILVGAVAVVASLGVMRCRAWGWGLGILALVLFVADGLLNGYLLFGRPGDRGTIVNVAAAALILTFLLRGRSALEPAPRNAPSASTPP